MLINPLTSTNIYLGEKYLIDWKTVLLLTVLMQTKYVKLTLRHNLFGVILSTDRYEHIYAKGAN